MDSDGSRMNIYITVLAAFLIIRTFYTFCEHSMVEVSDAKVKSSAEKSPKYQKLLDIISKPNEFRLTFSTHRILSCVAISILSFAAFAYPLEESLEKYFHEAVAASLSAIIVAIATAAAVLIFTDVLPKKISDGKSEKTALSFVVPFKLLKYTMLPLSAVTGIIVKSFCKIFRISSGLPNDAVTEEEILMMVDAGNETGIIEESQREMINNIFEFDDTCVSDVMTHRTDIAGVEINCKIGDVVSLAISEGFSRIPVYEESVDNIVGIINVKDLLCLVGREHSDDFTISQFMRKAEFVPETAKCKDVLKEMTLKKTQMMVIADEYGGTSGIVTMEDLLEEIVGNIQDEYDDEEAEITQTEKNVFTVDGSADPEDIFPMLGLELPETNNYDTMSAFFVDRLGRIPDENESAEISYKNVKFTVLLTEDNWVSKIKAVVQNSDEEPAE